MQAGRKSFVDVGHRHEVELARSPPLMQGSLLYATDAPRLLAANRFFETFVIATSAPIPQAHLDQRLANSILRPELATSATTRGRCQGVPVEDA